MYIIKMKDIDTNYVRFDSGTIYLSDTLAWISRSKPAKVLAKLGLMAIPTNVGR